MDDAQLRNLDQTIHALDPTHTREYLDKLIDLLVRIRAELDRPARHYASACQGCGCPVYPTPGSGLCTDCLAQ